MKRLLTSPSVILGCSTTRALAPPPPHPPGSRPASTPSVSALRTAGRKFWQGGLARADRCPGLDAGPAAGHSRPSSGATAHACQARRCLCAALHVGRHPDVRGTRAVVRSVPSTPSRTLPPLLPLTPPAQPLVGCPSLGDSHIRLE